MSPTFGFIIHMLNLNILVHDCDDIVSVHNECLTNDNCAHVWQLVFGTSRA